MHYTSIILRRQPLKQIVMSQVRQYTNVTIENPTLKVKRMDMIDKNKFYNLVKKPRQFENKHDELFNRNASIAGSIHLQSLIKDMQMQEVRAPKNKDKQKYLYTKENQQNIKTTKKMMIPIEKISLCEEQPLLKQKCQTKKTKGINIDLPPPFSNRKINMISTLKLSIQSLKENKIVSNKQSMKIKSIVPSTENNQYCSKEILYKSMKNNLNENSKHIMSSKKILKEFVNKKHILPLICQENYHKLNILREFNRSFCKKTINGLKAIVNKITLKTILNLAKQKNQDEINTKNNLKNTITGNGQHNNKPIKANKNQCLDTNNQMNTVIKKPLKLSKLINDEHVLVPEDDMIRKLIKEHERPTLLPYEEQNTSNSTKESIDNDDDLIGELEEVEMPENLNYLNEKKKIK